MTINEFKAWLEGFEASFAGKAPTDKQWAAIKAKMAAVSAPIAVNTPTNQWPYVAPPRWAIDDAGAWLAP